MKYLGTCSHCNEPGTVSRYRIWTVGLRDLDSLCFERLVALGLVVEPVTGDPRVEDSGVDARQNAELGIRTRGGDPRVTWLRTVA